MPFQSPKQRRYMHANLPEIANRWEKKYGLGGIAELNSQLNSLPEYYLPKNQGGRIGFDKGSNGITLGSNKYNIKLEPGASGSWTSQDLGHGYNVGQKNISYGVDTTANLGPVEIGIDFKNFLDKFDVTKDGRTVEKDTQKDKQIAYSLGLNLEDLYAKIDSDEEFENWYFTIRKTFSGGGTPAHQAGIYGLAEGGNIRLQPHTASDLLVQKTLSGERPKYQPPGHVDAPAPSSSGGGDAGHLSHNVSVSHGGTKPDPAPDHPNIHRDTGTEEEAYVMVGGKKVHQPKWGTQEDPRAQIQYEGGEDNEERLEIDLENARRKLKYDPNLTKNERQSLEVGLGLRAPKKAFSFGSFLGNAALAIIPGLLPAKMATAYRVGKLGYEIAYTDKYDATIEKFGFNKEDILSKVKGIGDSKLDLYESFADTPNHPERIALQAELEIGKKTPDDVPDRDGVTQETSITIDNIEEVNDAKTQLLRKYQEMDEASILARKRQKEMQAKKQAWLRQLRQTYMSAQGGRVPGGYNTGGLSNLFRLKNV